MRPGTILPLGACEERPDYDYAEEVLFQVYQLEEGTATTCEIPALDGTVSRSLTATQTGSNLKLELAGPHAGAWSVQLMGIDRAKSVEGGTLQASEGGLVIVPNKDSSTLTIQL